MDKLLEFWVGVAQAAFELGLPFRRDPATGLDRIHYNSFGEYFTDLVGLAVAVAGLLATAVIIYAGIIYSKSEGRAEQINYAKELAAGALTGLAILLMIRLVTPTLGIKVN